MKKDMTIGSPLKLIVQFAVPLLFGSLFQQLYNAVDTIVVGRFLGVDALAAVGATGSLNFMLIGFCMGCCSGFAIPVAQRFGAKDEKAMHRYIANGVWLSVLLTVLMTVLTVLFCRKILILMQTPDNILDMSCTYLTIMFWSIPAIVLYNLMGGILRAVGDSKTPVRFLGLTSVLNVVLDLLFVVVFHWGVAGAAWATMISQAVSGIGCLLYILKKTDLFQISTEDWKLRRSELTTLIEMGVPMGLQFSITAIGAVILQGAVNTLGSVAVASITASSKWVQFTINVIDCLGSAMATYGGQNLGAGKLYRVREGLRCSMLLGFAYSLIACLVIWLFGYYMLYLFVDSSEVEVLQNAYLCLKINGLAFMIVTVLDLLRMLIQGLGYSNVAIFSGVGEMIARLVVAWLFVPKFGFTGACLSNPLAWAFAVAFLIPAYMVVMKRLKKRGFDRISKEQDLGVSTE